MMIFFIMSGLELGITNKEATWRWSGTIIIVVWQVALYNPVRLSCDRRLWASRIESAQNKFLLLSQPNNQIAAALCNVICWSMGAYLVKPYSHLSRISTLRQSTLLLLAIPKSWDAASSSDTPSPFWTSSRSPCSRTAGSHRVLTIETS